MNEKKGIAKRNIRNFNTHCWWLKQLENKYHVVNYKYEKYKKAHDKLVDDIQYASHEYMRGIISEKDFKEMRAKNRTARGRYKRFMKIWQERKEYLEMQMKIEEELIENSSTFSGVQDYIERTGRGKR